MAYRDLQPDQLFTTRVRDRRHAALLTFRRAC